MMKQPELGKKISELRKAKGLTQEELVEKCKVSVRTLIRIEAGEVMPRSYTVKTIFAALDYNFYDSSKDANRFSKNVPSISNGLEQFYRYVLDLFNLKTNTMKKITILSIMFSAIVVGLLALNSESKGQSQDTNKQRTDKSPLQQTISYFTSISCSRCFAENGIFTGKDVKFTKDKTIFEVGLLRLDQNTSEFSTGIFRGKIFQNKVEVSCQKHMLDLGSITYTADKVDKKDSQIVLKGNAKLMNGQSEYIFADEIIVTTE